MQAKIQNNDLGASHWSLQRRFQLLLTRSGFMTNINIVEHAWIIFLTLAVLGCTSPIKEGTDESAVDILNSSKGFELVDIAAITDGGSIVYSFLSYDGEILHLWENNSIPSRESDRRYYLKTKYNDQAPVEVLHNSLLERQVLDMLEKCSRTRESFPPIPHTFDSILDDLEIYLQNRQREERTLRGSRSVH